MFKFKNSKDKNLFFCLHPVVIMVAAEMARYAQDVFEEDLIITQTVTTKEIDESLNRVSSSHRTCRAIDFSVKNLTDVQINELVNHINNVPSFLKYHYMSYYGERRLAFYHNGTAPHIHTAIHSRYSRHMSDAE